MRREILQKAIPYHWTDAAKLPGVMPLDPQEWIIFDEAYAGQMVEREILLQNTDEVIAVDRNSEAAACELLDTLLNFLSKKVGFQVFQTYVVTPDMRTVKINYDAPLLTCGLLVQNDFCIMQKLDDKHVLSAAVLCFPANWRLDEKFMKPLFLIHENVPEYTHGIAKRVDRIFEGIRVNQPLWRFNVLEYSNATLHQPYRLNSDRLPSFTRSERQTFLKLPGTGAVVFGIHTFVIKKVPLAPF
jgi:hypothetical protein